MLFDSLNITKTLDSPVKDWSYEKLDETNRMTAIAPPAA